MDFRLQLQKVAPSAGSISSSGTPGGPEEDMLRKVAVTAGQVPLNVAHTPGKSSWVPLRFRSDLTDRRSNS